jgi:hypothetical protein
MKLEPVFAGYEATLSPTARLPKTHRLTNTKALGRKVTEEEGERGKGLEFYQNSICKDPARIGIIWNMSVAGGQIWVGVGNDSCPGKEWSLGKGLCQVQVVGEGG